MPNDLRPLGVPQDNLAQQKKVMARMDNVNRGLKKNTEQLNRIVRTQLLLQRCSVCILLCTIVATVFILFEPQIFGS